MPKQLLVEKYRPKTVEDYIFPGGVVSEKVAQWIEEKEIPNVLLVSQPGRGKTTLSRILVNELGVDGSDLKSVNASLVSGIGFIREELEPWIKKRGFGGIKVVQLEEMDRLSADAQKALRQVSEDYSDRVRFIGTANYAKGISDALHSRFQTIHMQDMAYDDVLGYVCDIVDGESLEIVDDEDLISHVDAYFPDIRKIVNSIDQHVVNGQIAPLKEAVYGDDVGEWQSIWADGNVGDNFSKVVELSGYVDANNYNWFYQVMYENLDQFPDPEQAVIKISTYLDRAQRSANQALHLKACLYHIFCVDE